jgi:hypothetical protein
MQMEHSEYIKLQNQLQDHFDGRYKKKDDCDKTVESFEKSLNKDNIRLAVIEQQNKLMLWILAAVSGGIITMLIKMFFGD